MTPPKNTHRNDERTVKCPVEGCDATPLARGINLHIMRSAGDGHGPQGEVPDDIDTDDLETVGAKEVEMDYPEERESEGIARLCPYCGTPFHGKNGVLIHLGQVAGRKNHPENAGEQHDPDDFPAVLLDDNQNILAVVDEDSPTPGNEPHERAVEAERVYRYIADLLTNGKRDEAARARSRLLSEE